MQTTVGRAPIRSKLETVQKVCGVLHHPCHYGVDIRQPSIETSLQCQFHGPDVTYNFLDRFLRESIRLRFSRMRMLGDSQVRALNSILAFTNDLLTIVLLDMDTIATRHCTCLVQHGNDGRLLVRSVRKMRQAGVSDPFGNSGNYQRFGPLGGHHAGKEHLEWVELHYQQSNILLVSGILDKRIVRDQERDSAFILVGLHMGDIGALARRTDITCRIIWQVSDPVLGSLSRSVLTRARNRLWFQCTRPMFVERDESLPNNGIIDHNILRIELLLLLIKRLIPIFAGFVPTRKGKRTYRTALKIKVQGWPGRTKSGFASSSSLSLHRGTNSFIKYTPFLLIKSDLFLV